MLHRLLLKFLMGMDLETTIRMKYAGNIQYLGYGMGQQIQNSIQQRQVQE